MIDIEPQTILLTGSPGIGKTTVVRDICKELQKCNTKISGFYTEELRNMHRARQGFDVISLSGQRAVLARKLNTDAKQLPKIGNFSVYVREFESVAMPQIKCDCELLVLDEIGKMEMLSNKFGTAVERCIGKVPMLATIPLKMDVEIPIVKRLKTSPNAKLIVVTKFNRDFIKHEILNDLNDILTKKSSFEAVRAPSLLHNLTLGPS